MTDLKIHTLFPTYTGSADLRTDPDFEAANMDLRTLAYEYCSVPDPVIKTDDSDANVYTAHADRPGIIWLKQHVTEVVTKMAEQYQIEGYEHIRMLGSPQISAAGVPFYMHPHIHTYTSLFTACYYCDAGDSGTHGGEFKAWDPRWINTSMFNRTMKPHHTFKPHTGMLLIWPNIVWHDVNLYIGTTDRITFRTDISLPHSDFDQPKRY
jgi:hypothetical protein